MTFDILLKVLSLDLPKVNVKVKNTLCIIITSYITCTWTSRENIEYVTANLKAKIIRDQRLKMNILKEKAKDVFTENYCKPNIEFICTLI